PRLSVTGSFGRERTLHRLHRGGNRWLSRFWIDGSRRARQRGYGEQAKNSKSRGDSAPPAEQRAHCKPSPASPLPLVSHALSDLIGARLTICAAQLPNYFGKRAQRQAELALQMGQQGQRARLPRRRTAPV